MEFYSFTADSAAKALGQIRDSLGPEAIVLNVRPLPSSAFSRIWQKPMIEVVAYRPEEEVFEPAPVIEPEPEMPVIDYVAELNNYKAAPVPMAMPMPEPVQAPAPMPQREIPRQVPQPMMEMPAPAIVENYHDSDWRVGEVLRKTGFLPLNVQRVIDELRAMHGENPPNSLREEIALTRRVLENLWRKPRPIGTRSMHVLVGPAGSGKTTSLCKWLTQISLTEGRSARVWRLDGVTANMAESLSVYCDILGLPSQRSWQGEGLAQDIGFIDLPGVDWRQPMAIQELGVQLQRLGSPQVHLVLNGAYDTSVLLDQVRAFSILPVEDLIITHLDEDARWGKLWNLALGTNYSIRHFSTGQNIPGEYCEASADILFTRQFPRK